MQKKFLFSSFRISALIFFITFSLFFFTNFSCKKSKKIHQENLFEGLVTFKGEPQEGTIVRNLQNFEETKTDKSGKFRIKIETENDKIFVEKGTLAVITELKKEIEISELKTKIFHFRNFEKYMMFGKNFGEEGYILAVVPETNFVSPTLSQGTIIFRYPEGVSEVFLVSATWYAKIEIEKIKDWEVVDLDKLEKFYFPESISVLAEKGENIILEKVPEGYTANLTFNSSTTQNITNLSPGLYNIKIGEKSRYNVLLIQDTQIPQKGFSLKEEENAPYITSEVKIPLFPIIVWVEGEFVKMITNSQFTTLNFSSKAKRIIFSKFGFFPAEIKVENPESVRYINLELEYVSYITGKVRGSEKYFIELASSKSKLIPNIVRYNLDEPYFWFLLPANQTFLLTITAPESIPKLIEASTPNYANDLGEIYLCKRYDENCIIQEGLSFLRYGLFEKARETFLFSSEVSGKTGVIISDIGIFINEGLFKYNQNIVDEIEKIYEEVKNSGIDKKLCGLIPSGGISFFLLFSFPNMTGCVGKESLDFIVAAFKLLKAVKIYLLGNEIIIPTQTEPPALSFDPESLRNMGTMIEFNKNLFEFKSWFSPSTFIAELEDAIQKIENSIQSIKDCSSSDEVICKNNLTISGRIGNGFFPILSAKANLEGIIKSLKGEYNLKLTDILSLFPSGITGEDLPDFIEINLKNLLQNPLRRFLPKVSFYEGNPVLAIEVEVPRGFRGITNQEFVPPVFTIGDMKHFIYENFERLDEDGVFPQASTDKFDDYKSQEYIIYILFEDPSFGGAIKLKPCEVAITEQIWSRWCQDESKRNSFLVPNNQMFNDVFSVIQKFIGIQKILQNLIIK
jgi:hypothetical protein